MSRRPSLLSRIFDTNEIDPESRNKFLLVGGIVAVVFVSLALVVVGYYIDRVQSRGETVFVVGEREYNYDYLEDRVNAAAASGRISAENVQVGIATVVTTMQNEELFRLIGRDMGFTVTDEELEAGMKAYLRLPADIEHNEYARILREELLILGLSPRQFEEIVEAQIYEDRIRQSISEEIPEEVAQVQLRLILTESQEDMDVVMERLENGEAFEELAEEFSTHATAERGGDYGWAPRGVLPVSIEEAVFDLEVGELSEIVQSTSGFFLWRLEAREMRPLEDSDRSDTVTRTLGNRLDEAVETYGVENLLTFNQVNRIVAQLRVPGG